VLSLVCSIRRSIVVAAGTTTGLIDASGVLRVQSISGEEGSSGAGGGGLVAIVTSPGTSNSRLLPAETDEAVSNDNTQCLWLQQQSSSSTTTTSPCNLLICRGATLSATSEAERISLSTCSLVADSVILGGITRGDLQTAGAGGGGIRDSRHGRTLTALFRARICLEEREASDNNNNAAASAAAAAAASDSAVEGAATDDSEPPVVASSSSTKRQTLILPLPSPTRDGGDEEVNHEALKREIESIFLDVSIEKNGVGTTAAAAAAKTFDEMYSLELMSFADAGMVRSSFFTYSSRFACLQSSIAPDHPFV
jgi:hypothetical protein